jgi:hypothetical protein
MKEETWMTRCPLQQNMVSSNDWKAQSEFLDSQNLVFNLLSIKNTQNTL